MLTENQRIANAVWNRHDKAKKWSDSLVFGGIAFSLISTWWFGWNWSSESRVEEIADLISTVAVILGLFRCVRAEAIASIGLAMDDVVFSRDNQRQRPESTATISQ